MLELYAVMEYVTDTATLVEVFSTAEEARVRMHEIPASHEPFIRVLRLMEES